MKAKTPQTATSKESTGRLPPGVVNPVDVHVGSRLRLARHMQNISQGELGTSVGLTFQQIQKYERGSNRIGASRLYQFSEILAVPVGFFYDEMPEAISTREGAYNQGMNEPPPSGFNADPMTRRETLELIRNYYQIPDPQVRRNIYELVKTLAQPSDGRTPESDD